jgi:hypothetical protein
MWKRIVSLVLAASVAGCRPDLVEWTDASAVASDTLPFVPPGSSVGMYVSQAGLPPDSAMCAGSVVYAVDPEGDELTFPLFAAWLRLRADSTVAVMSARYAIAGRQSQWHRAVIVDSTDVAKLGCDRPRPSIASTNLNVHVSYSLRAPEGYGIFFAHSMDNGVSFHSPVIVVYGDRLSRTATAARMQRVVVAYEDPSGDVKRVDVAVSNTDGHTFEPRVHGSPEGISASDPQVAIRGDSIALSFVSGDSTSRVLRLGRIRHD